MSYQIEYDGRVGKYEVRPDRTLLPGILTAFGAFLILTLCFWPEGTAALRDLLIPGEDAVTVQAFQTMTDDLRSGAEISDAVEAFCRFVINGT